MQMTSNGQGLAADVTAVAKLLSVLACEGPCNVITRQQVSTVLGALL